jgi:flagellar protein FlaG
MVIDNVGSLVSRQPSVIDGSVQSQVVRDGQGQPRPVTVKHSSEQVSKAAQAANQRLELAQSQIRFNVSSEAGRLVVKMVDTQTKEVLLQIPNEQMMQIAQNLDKTQGMAVQKRA